MQIVYHKTIFVFENPNFAERRNVAIMKIHLENVEIQKLEIYPPKIPNTRSQVEYINI